VRLPSEYAGPGSRQRGASGAPRDPVGRRAAPEGREVCSLHRCPRRGVQPVASANSAQPPGTGCAARFATGQIGLAQTSAVSIAPSAKTERRAISADTPKRHAPIRFHLHGRPEHSIDPRRIALPSSPKPCVHFRIEVLARAPGSLQDAEADPPRGPRARQLPSARNAQWATAAGFPVILTHRNRAVPCRSATCTRSVAPLARGVRSSCNAAAARTPTSSASNPYTPVAPR
jgi:hypothetical protein